MDSQFQSEIAERDRLYDLAIIPAGVALNLAIALAVSAMKIPLFLDAIGTLSIVLMYRAPGRSPMWAAMFVGIFSFCIIAIFQNPTIIWFSHVQAAIAVYAFYVLRPLVRRMEANNTIGIGGWIKIVAAGIGLGLVSALLSAPVAALLFSGITPNGPGAVVALLLASGENLYKAVITGGLSIEPIDKTLQTIAAVLLYLSSPWRTRATVR
jgi:energy-coupling factor transport system substrate-specific component